jgi:hypothetical protein
MDDTPERAEFDASLGMEVFDDEGNPIGTVQGVDEHGFYVTREEGIRGMSREHVSAGSAGEAELTWRCSECGTIDDIEAFPEGDCPDCGAPQEAIYYHLQD